MFIPRERSTVLESCHCLLFLDFFKSNESRDISIEDAVKVSCFENTSESCTYEWQLQTSNSQMVFPSQKLPTDIQDLDLKKSWCLAQCTIRQHSCKAVPLVFNLIGKTFPSAKQSGGSSLLIGNT